MFAFICEVKFVMETIKLIQIYEAVAGIFYEGKINFNVPVVYIKNSYMNRSATFTSILTDIIP